MIGPGTLRPLYDWLAAGSNLLSDNLRIASGATNVTIDKSLKVRRGALSNRNVLTTEARTTKRIETDRWQAAQPA